MVQYAWAVKPHCFANAGLGTLVLHAAALYVALCIEFFRLQLRPEACAARKQHR